MGPQRWSTKVSKIGIVGADPQDCEAKQRLWRLPIPLPEWVFTTVGIAHGGANVLPLYVEFGVLHGRHYAEIEEYFQCP
jgi:hypothetical protein